jgi:hypothetical protein
MRWFWVLIFSAGILVAALVLSWCMPMHYG